MAADSGIAKEDRRRDRQAAIARGESGFETEAIKGCIVDALTDETISSIVAHEEKLSFEPPLLSISSEKLFHDFGSILDGEGTFIGSIVKGELPPSFGLLKKSQKMDLPALKEQLFAAASWTIDQGYVSTGQDKVGDTIARGLLGELIKRIDSPGQLQELGEKISRQLGDFTESDTSPMPLIKQRQAESLKKVKSMIMKSMRN